jgi:hypothetical protein
MTCRFLEGLIETVHCTFCVRLQAVCTHLVCCMSYSGKQRVRAKAIAEANGVSANHILDLFREGVIPGIKFGRMILFDPVECDKALERFKRPGKVGAVK